MKLPGHIFSLVIDCGSAHNGENVFFPHGDVVASSISVADEVDDVEAIGFSDDSREEGAGAAKLPKGGVSWPRSFRRSNGKFWKGSGGKRPSWCCWLSSSFHEVRLITKGTRVVAALNICGRQRRIEMPSRFPVPPASVVPTGDGEKKESAGKGKRKGRAGVGFVGGLPEGVWGNRVVVFLCDFSAVQFLCVCRTFSRLLPPPRRLSFLLQRVYSLLWHPRHPWPFPKVGSLLTHGYAPDKGTTQIWQTAIDSSDTAECTAEKAEGTPCSVKEKEEAIESWQLIGRDRLLFEAVTHELGWNFSICRPSIVFDQVSAWKQWGQRYRDACVSASVGGGEKVCFVSRHESKGEGGEKGAEDDSERDEDEELDKDDWGSGNMGGTEAALTFLRAIGEAAKSQCDSEEEGEKEDKKQKGTLGDKLSSSASSSAAAAASAAPDRSSASDEKQTPPNETKKKRGKRDGKKKRRPLKKRDVFPYPHSAEAAVRWIRGPFYGKDGAYLRWSSLRDKILSNRPPKKAQEALGKDKVTQWDVDWSVYAKAVPFRGVLWLHSSPQNLLEVCQALEPPPEGALCREGQLWGNESDHKLFWYRAWTGVIETPGPPRTSLPLGGWQPFRLDLKPRSTRFQTRVAAGGEDEAVNDTGAEANKPVLPTAETGEGEQPVPRGMLSPDIPFWSEWWNYSIEPLEDSVYSNALLESGNTE
uniref:Uncharacterized protein n=1 Tax=Chromera velia CCMP2878 TaxID=1169474 RepID=A0A0G4GUI5_9ALVE|eukprot:Cvel_751.t1-p1 / transcript=Cvel_751.t1 / gene=Cvel_751 / organism=Chromera_velia_CCMP2878 / gene_product=hypothetical protein / transcript_product=hypothetical protein / location=Cvel_scaffold23:93133-96640(+) / protein_length=699 / sequence_SO=supercontig / SO=protein_coding / is_pseudo=false